MAETPPSYHSQTLTARCKRPAFTAGIDSDKFKDRMNSKARAEAAAGLPIYDT